MGRGDTARWGLDCLDAREAVSDGGGFFWAATGVFGASVLQVLTDPAAPFQGGYSAPTAPTHQPRRHTTTGLQCQSTASLACAPSPACMPA